MDVKRNTRESLRDEKGMVLVVALLLIAALVLLGTTAVMMSTTDMKISSNYRSSTQAFYIAEAGLEAARNQLRTNLELPTPITINQMLAAAAGNDGNLYDSTNISNFYSNGTFGTADVLFIEQPSFGDGRYSVYLTNDGTDGVTSVTDTNNKVTLTSIGQGPGNSLAILQEVVQKLTLPPLPGALVFPGPGITFNGANSNASGIIGGTESAISTTDPAAEAAIEANLTSLGRLGNYTCVGGGSGAACINTEPAFDPAWITVAGIEGLANTFLSAANTKLPNTAQPGPGPYTLTAAQVGSTSNRQIVFVDGDANIGASSGAEAGGGILIVTGRLTLTGNFNYNGLIMCIGKGELYRFGGGSVINGGVFVAKTRDSSGNLLSTLGNLTFDTSGGGNSNIRYDANELSKAGGTRFLRKSWQQI